MALLLLVLDAGSACRHAGHDLALIQSFE